MTWPSVVFWILIFAAAASDGPALLYVFAMSAAFGTLQMLPSGFGNANLLPQVACAAVLVCKILLKPGNAMRALSAATDPRRLGLLVAFLVYGLATAALLPRVFTGRIELFSVTGALTGTSLLEPSIGNVTQSCYVALSIATAVAIAIVGSQPDFRQHYLIATLLCGLVVVATGLLDLVTYALGIGSILEPFRSVTYTLLTEAEALGAKRVVGLMSEASSYGSLCVTSLGLLTFLRPCFPSRLLRRTVVPLTIGALLVMAALSTSSGAYAGLCVYGGAFALNWFIRLGTRDVMSREDLRSELVVVVLAPFALLCVYVFAPDSLASSGALLDATVFEKSTSSSYLERGTWTAFGWHAFLDTDGLGVGLGSLRVSNWVVSILGSTGALGAVLMFGFLIGLLIPMGRPRAAAAREWQRGLRLSLLPPLAMLWLIGTMPDFGVGLAATIELLVAAGPVPRHVAPGHTAYATQE